LADAAALQAAASTSVARNGVVARNRAAMSSSRIEISLAESVRGAQRNLQLTIRDTETGQQEYRNVTVKIPAGVGEGSRVRVAKQGASGTGGGPNGDLYLIVRIAPHPFWKREGDNLLCEVPVTFS
jgi:DnaJ-class molecular chaperone